MEQIAGEVRAPGQVLGCVCFSVIGLALTGTMSFRQLSDLGHSLSARMNVKVCG
jgi:hypothetical protein